MTVQSLLDDAWLLAKELFEDETRLDSLAADLETSSSDALEYRLSQLLQYHRGRNGDDKGKSLRKLIEALAYDNGSLVAIGVFTDRLKRPLAGIVMTAHPTFSMSKTGWIEAKKRLSNAISLEKNQEINAAEVGIRDLSLLPESSPSLEDELAYANDAIDAVRSALRDVWHEALSVGIELYPDQWHHLTPQLVTVASWVGFDLDGRTDIGWAQSLHFKYVMTLAGLERLSDLWTSIAPLQTSSSKNDIGLVGDSLIKLLGAFQVECESLKVASAKVTFGEYNRLAVAQQETKTSARSVISSCLARLMETDLEVATLKEISVFRCEWQAIGLGLSHIHFRLNAAQLHNAIRSVVNMKEAPDRSASRRHYLDAIGSLLDDVKPVNIHFGDLCEEQTTARRVFMLAAQFKKHFDDTSALRMLVAESDTPFTLLTALYYAKQFGVDDYVEISPLFETAIGLQRGDRVIAELLGNPHFLDYIKRQGRFCVQLGFSDSGRYIGQIAAALAIERFKLRLIRLWQASGLSDVNLVFFDTHGESMGRGAHPISMEDRFYYTHSEEVRRRLLSMGNQYKHEVSFQGGDGYLHFLHSDLAYSTVFNLLATRIEPPAFGDDALYADSDWSLDFFLTLTETQERMTNEKGYVRLIDSIGQAMLYPTGSRALKRQGRGVHGQYLDRIGQIRAIPNNAVLQQLGFAANLVMGVGAALNRNPRRFREVYEKSPRLKSLMAMVLKGLEVSSVEILGAYLKILSPSHLLDQCEGMRPSKARGRLLRLAKSLEGVFDGNAMRSVLRQFRHDGYILEDMLEVAGLERPKVNQDLLDLHTIRLALIHFIHIKAVQIPQFSSRQDVSLDEFIEAILHLDIEGALAELREIFPRGVSGAANEDFGETSTFLQESSGVYSRLHTEIFDPVERASEMIQVVSAVIATRIGAVG